MRQFESAAHSEENRRNQFLDRATLEAEYKPVIGKDSVLRYVRKTPLELLQYRLTHNLTHKESGEGKTLR